MGRARAGAEDARRCARDAAARCCWRSRRRSASRTRRAAPPADVRDRRRRPDRRRTGRRARRDRAAHRCARTSAASVPNRRASCCSKAARSCSATFPDRCATRRARSLERLGVEVRTGSVVTGVDGGRRRRSADDARSLRAERCCGRRAWRRRRWRDRSACRSIARAACRPSRRSRCPAIPNLRRRRPVRVRAGRQAAARRGAGRDAAGRARGAEHRCARSPGSRSSRSATTTTATWRRSAAARRSRRIGPVRDVGLARLALLAVPAHLLADRLPQPLGGARRVGMGVRHVPAPRAADHRRKLWPGSPGSSRRRMVAAALQYRTPRSTSNESCRRCPRRSGTQRPHAVPRAGAGGARRRRRSGRLRGDAAAAAITEEPAHHRSSARAVDAAMQRRPAGSSYAAVALVDALRLSRAAVAHAAAAASAPISCSCRTRRRFRRSRSRWFSLQRHAACASSSTGTTSATRCCSCGSGSGIRPCGCARWFERRDARRVGRQPVRVARAGGVSREPVRRRTTRTCCTTGPASAFAPVERAERERFRQAFFGAPGHAGAATSGSSSARRAGRRTRTSTSSSRRSRRLEERIRGWEAARPARRFPASRSFSSPATARGAPSSSGASPGLPARRVQLRARWLEPEDYPRVVGSADLGLVPAPVVVGPRHPDEGRRPVRRRRARAARSTTARAWPSASATATTACCSRRPSSSPTCCSTCSRRFLPIRKRFERCAPARASRRGRPGKKGGCARRGLCC